MKTQKNKHPKGSFWAPVRGKNNAMEEIVNGKKTGRIARKILSDVPREEKMEKYNEYIQNNSNTIVIYDNQNFEPYLFRITNQ
jgi:hypothetical protein